jgi:hypothetical protein
MKIAIALLAGIFFGGIVVNFWNALDHEYITVRVIDNDKCDGREYIVELDSQFVSVKDNQVELENTPIAQEAEAFIYLIPPYDAADKIKYKLHATYSDCKNIESEIRVVERGWVLYEFIEGGKITHRVRSQ